MREVREEIGVILASLAGIVLVAIPVTNASKTVRTIEDWWETTDRSIAALARALLADAGNLAKGTLEALEMLLAMLVRPENGRAGLV